MKHLKYAGLNLAAGLVLLATPLISGLASAAGGGTTDFTLSPSSGNYSTGSVLTVQVYEDSGSDPVYATDVNLNYSSNLSWDPNSGWADGPVFGVDATTTGGSGVVNLSRSLSVGTPAVSGKNLIITLYFTVNASGTATINFASGTDTKYVPPASTNVTVYNANPQNGTYNVPASPPSGGGAGSSGGSSSSGSSSSGSTSKSKPSSSPSPSPSPSTGSSTPLATSNTSFGGQSVTLSNISVSDLSGYSATINWQTNVPATSQVNYGPASDQLYFSASSSTLSTYHSVKLSKTNLLAGQTYYYAVKSADANGNVATSSVQSFKMVTPAGTTSKNNSNTTTLVAAAALTLIIVSILLAGHYIRKMHHNAKELDSHFLSGDPMKPSGSAGSGPVAGSSSSQVVTPQNNNLPPTSGLK